MTVATSDRAAEEALHPPHVAALRALAARGESLTHESAPRAREAAKRAAALCREAARSRRVFGQDARHTRYLAQYSLLGGSSLATLCKHNASVHRAVGLHAEAQTWLILERIFTPLAVPNTVRAGARELVGGGSTQFLRHASSLDALRGSGRDTGSQPAGRGRSVPGRSPGSTPAPGTAGDEAALAPEGAVAADSEAIAHAGRGAEARLPHPHPHRARTASSHGTGRRQAPARRTRGRATSAFGPSVPDSVNRLVTAMEDEASLGRSAADPPGSRPLRRRRGLRAEDVAPGGPAQAEEEVSVAETSVRPDSPAQVPAVAAAGTSAPTTFPGLGVSADAEGKGPGEEDAGAASHVDAALQAATERYKRVAGAGGGEGQGEGEGGGGGGGGERSAGLRRVNGTSPTAGGEDGGESSDFYDSTSPVGPGDLWEDSGDSDVADTAVELADEMQQAGIVAGGSVLHAIPVPVSAIPGNGEGRSEVQDALSMTSALDWGGEDGTTFSRAGGPSQTLRQSGRVEAVGGPSASAAEDGGLRGRERELDAAVRDTLAVHEEEERRALAWLREGVVTDLVEFLLQQGDVQMCAHVLTVLGPARTPTVSRRQRQGVLVSYIDLLHRLGEYVTATEVLKYCEDAGLQEMNQKATSVALSCCRCGKGLDPSERDRCSGCRAALTTCTVTGTRIKGLYAWNPVQPEAGSLWHCLDKVQETS